MKRKADVFRYGLGGVVNESAFIFTKNEKEDMASSGGFGGLEDNNRVFGKLKKLDELLFSKKSGIILGLKNGNAFIDGGIKVEFRDEIKVFSAYPIYVDKENKIVDDNELIDGQDIFEFEKRMRDLNPKLRIDGTMTSGYCESEEMAKLITRLNTRGSSLDVWRH